MKLFLSNIGIEESIKYEIKDIISELNSAKNKVSRCPSSFSYASFVNSLPSKINQHITRLEKLEEVAKSTDKKYQEMLSDSKTKIESISDPAIKERLGFKKTNFDISVSGISNSLKATHLRASDIVKEISVKETINPNLGRGRYQESNDFNAQEVNIEANVVDPNSGRGRYQETNNFNAQEVNIDAKVIDPNSGRGRYQETNDFSAQGVKINEKVVDPNSGRGKYQS